MEKNKKLTEEITNLKREHESQALRMTEILEASKIVEKIKRNAEEALLKDESTKRLTEEALRENDAIIIEKDE